MISFLPYGRLDPRSYIENEMTIAEATRAALAVLSPAEIGRYAPFSRAMSVEAGRMAAFFPSRDRADVAAIADRLRSLAIFTYWQIMHGEFPGDREYVERRAAQYRKVLDSANWVQVIYALRRR
jgi:hypothetical protein